MRDSRAEQIIEILKERPEITRKQLADSLKITSDGVKYHLKKLKESGRIEHIGSTKSGKWIVKK